MDTQQELVFCMFIKWVIAPIHNNSVVQLIILLIMIVMIEITNTY